MAQENSSDSDYTVEEFVKPDRVKTIVNDESADLLGNFDDEKRKEIFSGTYVDKNINENPIGMESSSSEEEDDDEGEKEDKEDREEVIDDPKGLADLSNGEKPKQKNNQFTQEQLTSLLRGAAKANRYVVYVTNLNFETNRSDLETHFGAVGEVKSVRIPKKTRGGFAFVEMIDIKGFQQALQQHNTLLRGRQIKVQISEAGKKKSANKRNILKQKNRKLAEMRKEAKAFTKSGKFYDKSLKKDKAKELLLRKRWRKKPAAKT